MGVITLIVALIVVVLLVLYMITRLKEVQNRSKKVIDETQVRNQEAFERAQATRMEQVELLKQVLENQERIAKMLEQTKGSDT